MRARVCVHVSVYLPCQQLTSARLRKVPELGGGGGAKGGLSVLLYTVL